MKDLFIVKDEKEFFLNKKQIMEDKIKVWISKGFKVVMSKGYAVGIEPKENDLTNKEIRDLCSLAEEYVLLLKRLEETSQ